MTVLVYPRISINIAQLMRYIVLLQNLCTIVSLERSISLNEFISLSRCVLRHSLQASAEFEDMNLLPLVRWAAGGRPGTFMELGANDVY